MRHLANALRMGCSLGHGRDQIVTKAAHHASPSAIPAAVLMIAAKPATAFFSSGVRSVACALA
jgi:hypothetical protein